jgi:hypothetical protein
VVQNSQHETQRIYRNAQIILSEFRKKLSSTTQQLQEFIDMLREDRLIDDLCLNESRSSLDELLIKQEELRAALSDTNIVTAAVALSDIEKAIDDLVHSESLFEKAKIALQEFQAITSNNQEALDVIITCKDKAERLLASLSKESAIDVALAYAPFVARVNDSELGLTDDQWDAIEAEFPKKAVRSLNNRDYYIAVTDDSHDEALGDFGVKGSDPREPAENDVFIPEASRIAVDIAAATTGDQETVPAQGIASAIEQNRNQTEKSSPETKSEPETVSSGQNTPKSDDAGSEVKQAPFDNSQYEFSTNDRKFIATSFIKSYAEKKGKGKWRYRGPYGFEIVRCLFSVGSSYILSKKQISKYIVSNEKSADNVINRLHHEGLITRIQNTKNDELLYCLSKNGHRAFTQARSRELLEDVSRAYPNEYILDTDFQNGLQPIEAIREVNEVALWVHGNIDIYFQESMDIAGTSSTLIHKVVDDNPTALIDTLTKAGNEIITQFISSSAYEAIHVTELEDNRSLLNNFVIVGKSDFEDIDTAKNPDRLFFASWNNDTIELRSIDGNILEDPMGALCGGVKDSEIIEKPINEATESVELDAVIALDEHASHAEPEEFDEGNNSATVESEEVALDDIVVCEDTAKQDSATVATEECHTKNIDIALDTTAAIVDERTSEQGHSLPKQIEEPSAYRDFEFDSEVKRLADVALSDDPDAGSTKGIDALFSALLYPEESADSIIVVPLNIAYAVTLAEALSLLDNPKTRDKYRKLYYQYSLAFDLGVTPVERSSKTIALAFTEETISQYQVAAYLRALLFPSVEYDYQLYESAKVFLFGNKDFLSSYGSLYSILELLANMNLSLLSSGFNSSILARFAEAINQSEVLQELSMHAKNYLPMPKGKNLKLMHQFNVLCFGERSDMAECLRAVEKDDISAIDVVEMYYQEIKDSESIGKKIDESWDRVVGDNKVGRLQSLKGKYRNTAVNNFENRRTVLQGWLQVHDDTSPTAKEDAFDLRGKILEGIQEILKSDAVSAPDVFAIQYALCDIQNALLSGKRYERQFAFSDFLLGYWIDLDDEFRPRLDSRFNKAAHFQPWKSVLRHITSCRRTQEEVIELIERDGSFYFDNFGNKAKLQCLLRKVSDSQAEIDDIQAEIEAEIDKEQKNIEKAKKLLIEDSESFAGDFNLAFTHGQITEDVKDIVLEHEENLREFFIENYNFGNYRFFLKSQKYILEEEREKTRIAKTKIFEELMKGHDSDNELAEAIRKKIAEDNFNVAEDYLNLLASGEHSLPDSISEDEGGIFRDFLDKFEDMFDFAASLKNREFSKCARKSEIEKSRFGTNHLNDWDGQQWAQADSLLCRWVSPDQRSTTSNLKIFFELLGFKVTTRAGTDQAARAGKPTVFNLQCKPTSKDRRDYLHPIAVYGTQMPEPLSVISVLGKHTPEELTRTVTSMNKGNGSIVLLDSYYSLPERRQLAKLLKVNMSNSFLLIDQVLLLYLATLGISSRLPSLLKCGLPYSFIQPFTNGSSAIGISEEMFFGRKTELSEILSYNGANIVYGGRQLGKTALLHRAKSLAYDPKNQKYALFVDANKLGIDETLKKLSTELAGIGFGKGNYESFAALFSDLSRYFGKSNQKKKIKDFLLLIDEADSFFEEAMLDDYRIIQSFREMQVNHRGSFKFVFAGLHNVARLRESRKNNSIIPQLGEPLCIKPMSVADARDLVMRPLSYLGFTDPDKELEKILPRTNYYPGILQYFGYILLDEVSKKYTQYYNQNDNPPFPLDANLMKKTIGSPAIVSEIRKKLRITIELREIYELLANAITFLYYEDIDEKLELVYSIDKITEFIKDYQIQVLINMGREEIISYLDEMVEMGVLWGSPDSPREYRLLRTSFARTIGTKDEVDDYIQEHCG